MKIESPRFGTLEVSQDRVIEFPQGLPGFEQLRRYSIFHPEGEGEPNYYILQSLDDASVAFHIADPARFGFDYEIALTDDEAATIGLTDVSKAVVAVMLIKEASSGAMRANVKAPLILNPEKRLGMQHAFAKLSYRVNDKAA
jgi:flagellar assembly factor FliW